MSFRALSKVFNPIGKGKYAYNTPYKAISQHEIIGAPALGTNTAVRAAFTLTDKKELVTSGIQTIDFPRALLVKGSASGMVGLVIIKGKDANGYNTEEHFDLNGSSVVAGRVAFSKVDSVIMPEKTNASGDTVSIGTTNKIALLHPIKATGDVKRLIVAGTAEAPSAVDATYSTVTATTALDGVKVIEVIYNTKSI